MSDRENNPSNPPPNTPSAVELELQVKLTAAEERIVELEAQLRRHGLEPNPLQATGVVADWNPHLLTRWDELEIVSNRVNNCFNNYGIEYVYQVVPMTRYDLMKIKNFGRKSMNEIEELLDYLGLRTGMKLDGFVPPPGYPPV